MPGTQLIINKKTNDSKTVARLKKFCNIVTDYRTRSSGTRTAAEAESRPSSERSGGGQRSCKYWVDRRKGNLFTFSTIRTRLIIAQQFAYAHTTAQTSLPRRNKLNESVNEHKKRRLEKVVLILWELTDSNRRPSACKAGALNQLS